MKPSVLIPGMSAQLSNVPSASGSSLFTLNNTTQVSCAVYHSDVKPRQEQSQQSTIEVLIKPLNGKISHKTREFEHMIRNCLEYAILTTMYPRSLIRVVFQIVKHAKNNNNNSVATTTALSNSQQQKHHDGHLLSCMLNASMLALMNAGIAIKSLLASCSFDTCGGWAWFVYEKNVVNSQKTTVQQNALNLLVCSHMEGMLFAGGGGDNGGEKDEKLLEECIGHGANDVSPHIFQFYREVMANTVTATVMTSSAAQ